MERFSGIDLFFSIALSVILAFALLRAIKIEIHNWLLLVLGLLPTALIYLWNPYIRVYGAHGFIPPNNPILAGKALHYPWVHHDLVAAIANELNISPQMWLGLMASCWRVVLEFALLLISSFDKQLYRRLLALPFVWRLGLEF